jgi:hypothetical protein
MACPTGIEPVTLSLEGCHKNGLTMRVCSRFSFRNFRVIHRYIARIGSVLEVFAELFFASFDATFALN